jgi:uncharacterized protein YecE (DUF72 family)
LCLAESEKFEVPQVITAGFVYVRLRKEDYSVEERTEIAARVKGLLADHRDVFVFFKHEDTPAGAKYAEELLKTAQGAAIDIVEEASQESFPASDAPAY